MKRGWAVSSGSRCTGRHHLHEPRFDKVCWFLLHLSERFRNTMSYCGTSWQGVSSLFLASGVLVPFERVHTVCVAAGVVSCIDRVLVMACGLWAG